MSTYIAPVKDMLFAMNELAGLQDIVSGWLINSGKTELDGVTSYNFDSAIVFWIAASALSFILALFVSKKSHA